MTKSKQSAGKGLFVIMGTVLILLFLLMSCVFMVDQRQTALVLRLGKPVGELKKPGINFKLPIVDKVLYFDSRILEHDTTPNEILTKDKKNMTVDYFVKFRIVDPLAYYRTVRTLSGAKQNLDKVVSAQLQEVLGRYTLTELVAEKRAAIMEEITKKSAVQLKEFGFGIDLVDVRIKRTDLPPQNEKAIFDRMREERKRQATKYRSEGKKAASILRSEADKKKTIILANAAKQASILRGEGDAQAVKVYAGALNLSPEFYAFQRSLEAYEKSFTGKTRIILTPENDFFQYFQ